MKLARMIPARELTKGLDLVIISFTDRPSARGRVVMIEHTSQGAVHVCLEDGMLFGLQGNSMVGLVEHHPSPRPSPTRPPRLSQPHGGGGGGAKIIPLKGRR